jgi:gliding motility-associated-like protein
MVPVTPTASFVVVQPSVNTTYTLLVSNQYGCVGADSILVPLGTKPNVTSIRTHFEVCPGFTSTLTAYGAQTYTWTGYTFTTASSPQTTTIGPISQQTISAPPGTYTVIGSNGGTCLDTTSTIVNIMPPLDVKITTNAQPTNTTCIFRNSSPKQSKPIVLTATGASDFVWTPYDPNIMTFSIGPTTAVTPPATMQFTVIGSTDVCATATAITINVIPQFVFDVNPDQPVMCKGDSLKLTIDVAKITGNRVAPLTYSWTESGALTIDDYHKPEVTVYPEVTSNYSVEIKDSRGCLSIQRIITVTVLPTPMTSVAIPTINGVPTNTLCYVGNSPGEPFNTLGLIASNQNSGLPFGVTPTYTWITPYQAPYKSILTSNQQAGIVINAPLKLPSTVTYTVISGYNGVKGCRVEDTVTVRIIDCRPVYGAVDFNTVDNVDTLCVRQCVTFVNLTDTAAGGPQTLEWEFEGGSPLFSNDKFPTVCYNLPGQYRVLLRVTNPWPSTNQNGSTELKGKENYIKVVDVPNVTIVKPGQKSSDTTVRFGTVITLKGSGALWYAWEPESEVTPVIGDSIVTVKPINTTQVRLIGYNSNECFSSDTVNVIVVPDCGEIFVPTAFSPNGDGTNDVLYVRGICLKDVNFLIFNRWGEKVFESNDQAKGWDGTYKGELMNSGVFVYRIEGRTYEGKPFSAKGNVTLIR